MTNDMTTNEQAGGEPAFPVVHAIVPEPGAFTVTPPAKPGLTKREYFAIQALPPIILKLNALTVTATGTEEEQQAKIEAIRASFMPAAARGAVAYADALIEALAESRKEGR